MPRYQLRLLLLSMAAVVLIVVAVFFADWFVVHVGGANAHIDLRRIRFCSPQCQTFDVSKGMYGTLATLAFWSSLPLFVVVATQAGAKLLSGYAYPPLAKIGTGLGMISFFSAFGAGFLAAPEDASFAGFELMTADRMWGPLALMAGSILGVLAVRYAMSDGVDDTAGEYKPVVIDKKPDSHDGTERPRLSSSQQVPLTRNKSPSQQPMTARTRAPSQPPLDARSKSPSQAPLDARSKSPSQAPLDARSKSPSQAPLDTSMPSRARTSSSGPVDVAARLGGQQLDIAIRPPLPEALPLPDDQIPVAPESGLTIRKRSPSTAPETSLALPPEIGMSIRTRAPSVAPMMPSVASALGMPPELEPVTPLPPSAPVVPPASKLPLILRGRVKYAVTTAVFSSAGIDATREDGTAKLIKWTSIVGIVARRMPSLVPYDGLTFVDIVSTAGSTMRILPATELLGHVLEGNPSERARALVNLLAAMALDAKLDTATKVFATGTSNAAQLKDEPTLSTHDTRLA